MPSGLYIFSTLIWLSFDLSSEREMRRFFLVFTVMANDTCSGDNSVLISILFVQI